MAKLNGYFVSVGQTLAAKISLSTHYFRKYLNPAPLNSFSINPSPPEEEISIGYSLCTTHSTGLHDIDPCIANANIALIAVGYHKLLIFHWNFANRLRNC